MKPALLSLLLLAPGCTILTGLFPDCGDFVLDAGEECDDGNQLDGDGCDAACRLEAPPAACGNGVEEAGEECDLGAQNADTGACTTSCTNATCGDGFIQPSNNESCEPPGQAGCDAQCRLPCETPADCDDQDACTTEDCVGNACQTSPLPEIDDGDACTIDTCDAQTGAVSHTPVEIDDQNPCTTDSCDPATGVVSHVPALDGTSCEADGDPATLEICLGPSPAVPSCLPSICGDAVTDSRREQCDDGNQTNGDACDSNCTTPRCGNGIAAGSEQCDDGNTNNNDGCSNACQLRCTAQGLGAENAQLDSGRCYAFYLTPEREWQDAQDFCVSKGQELGLPGHLATVTSAAERDVVDDVVDININVWIGANDINNEGSFVWVTGEPFVINPGVTSFFRAEQPNNGGQPGSNQDCLVQESQGGADVWNDFDCEGIVDSLQPFVCEFP